MPALPAGTTPLTGPATVLAANTMGEDTATTVHDNIAGQRTALGRTHGSTALDAVRQEEPASPRTSPSQRDTSTTARAAQATSATTTNSASNTGQSEGRSGSSDDAAGLDETATEPIPIIAERFKTKMCKNFETTGGCEYGSRCMFAHGARELRTTEQNMADGITNQGSVYALRRRMAKRAKAASEGTSLAAPTAPTGQSAPAPTPPQPHPITPFPTMPPYALPPWPPVAPRPLPVTGTVPGFSFGGTVVAPPLAGTFPPPLTTAVWPPAMPIPPPAQPAPPVPMMPWW